MAMGSSNFEWLDGTTELSLDHVLRNRAEAHADTVVLAYEFTDGVYRRYTYKDVELLTRAAISTFPDWIRTLGGQGGGMGIEPSVGVVGISSLEYCITFIALQRLGIMSLALSPRLADQGFAHLIRQCNCKAVLAFGPSIDVMKRVKDQQRVDFEIIPIVDFERLETMREQAANVPLPRLEPKHPDESPSLIVHSGGTTGLPKPVHLSSGIWLQEAAHNVKHRGLLDTLMTLPLFHSYGMTSLFAFLRYGKRCMAMPNAERPLTVSAILHGLDQNPNIRALATVPLVLKFFAETEDGLERLGKLDAVVSAGSATPKALGDAVVAHGTILVSPYGQTESGALLWNDSGENWPWLFALPVVEPHLQFEKVGEEGQNLYQLIVKPGLRTKRMSNRPDGSYDTGDLFERHPTDPRKWRYVARNDDIIVLINGEKADPVPLEHTVSANVNVQTAVVFGAARDSLGMIVIPSSNAAALSRQELLDSIAADLEKGNSQVPAYARVPLEGIIFKEVGSPVPMTAKSTIVRSKFLDMHKDDIERYYASRESAQNGARATYSDEEMAELVRATVKAEMRLDQDVADDADLFSLGMDSLQASHVRSRLLNKIDLRGGTLTTNAVFDHPTIKKLTQFVQHVGSRQGRDPTATEVSAEAAARAVLQKYSAFPPAHSETTQPRGSGHVILLTGATGTIGRHILNKLLSHKQVDRVICLVRAPSDVQAASRIQRSLEDGRLDALDAQQSSKLVAVASDIGEKHFGLSHAQYDALRTSVTHIIHNAWAVNFNMGLSSFEKPCVSSLHHLLNLALSSPTTPMPTVSFVSSIAAVLEAEQTPVPEALHGWKAASPMGYGQSKWVAEEMCAAAARHCRDLRVQILRLGQVAGDTRNGVWNPTEAIPAIVQSALTIGALPRWQGHDEKQYWLPADIAGEAMVELALRDGSEATSSNNEDNLSVFHVSSTRPVAWNSDFLPALCRQGLVFEALPHNEWLQRLENSNPDPGQNPPYRLLQYFQHRFGGDPGDRAGTDEADLVMDQTEALRYSSALRKTPAVDEELIGKFLRYWLSLDGWKGLRG